MRQERAAQSVGIAVPHVVNPTLHGNIYTVKFDFTGSVGAKQSFEAASKRDGARAFQTAMRGENAKAEKRNSRGRGEDAARAFVQAQAQLLQKRDGCRAPRVQLRLVVREQQKIVHVPHVGAAFSIRV